MQHPYDIPQLHYKRKLMYFSDILIFALFIFLVISVFPIHWAAGIDGVSPARAAHIQEKLQENLVPEGYFDRFFATGSLNQFVQPAEKKDSYIGYRNGLFGPCYRQGVARNVSHIGSPTGLFFGSHLVSVNGNQIYYDNSEGLYGWIDADVDRMFLTNHQLDFAKVRNTLARGATEKLSLSEAAGLYSLIRNGQLIGYADGTAWFAINKDGTSHIYSCAPDGSVITNWQTYHFRHCLRVIDNRYLLQDYDDKVLIWELHTGAQQMLTLGEPLLGMDYAVNSAGRITVFAITKNRFQRFDLTGEGAEYCNAYYDNLKKSPLALTATIVDDNLFCWVRYKNEYTLYER